MQHQTSRITLGYHYSKSSKKNTRICIRAKIVFNENRNTMCTTSTLKDCKDNKLQAIEDYLDRLYFKRMKSVKKRVVNQDLKLESITWYQRESSENLRVAVERYF